MFGKSVLCVTRTQSVDPDLAAFSYMKNQQTFFAIRPTFKIRHIGTECTLSGPKFSSAETGMGVTSRP